ncbi:MAG TPA: MBL fold metallo-hydrolase [Gaiellaceae bacterium]|nr:MBL fold metallo-hydrolase [Gaiellaceae bacterium]
MDVHRLAPRLWRWTAYHEEWRQDVGCVYLETEDATVLIDPLVPAGEPERFLDYLDADVERAGKPVHILLTVYWHVRSSSELAKRYRAEVWAPKRSALPVERRIHKAPTAIRPGDALPGNVEAHESGRASELVYVLPAQRALVAGDVLLGGPLRICPPGWVGKGGQAAVREALRPLLDRPLDRVLVSHGEPVLRGGQAALASALA